MPPRRRFPLSCGDLDARRQLRGTAADQIPGADQITGVGRVLVTAGTGVPTSGLVLAADE
ncbi:hypothetical protein ACWEKM_30360 [Streptomyces sp. NPDC004752]